MHFFLVNTHSFGIMPRQEFRCLLYKSCHLEGKLDIRVMLQSILYLNTGSSRRKDKKKSSRSSRARTKTVTKHRSRSRSVRKDH